MSKPFIKILREAQELFENDIDAFVVLMQMAFRTRWKESPYNKDALQIGESLIGRDDAIRLKLNEQRYRDAKKRIEQDYKLGTFKGTSKGTIAKFTDNRVCDLNIENSHEQKNEQKNEQYFSKRTSKERAKNEQAPTNEERKKERRVISDSKESSTTMAALPPAPPDSSITKQTAKEALIAHGFTKDSDIKQLFKSWGSKKIWLGLQHIFSNEFTIETTPIQALNWVCSIEAWNKPKLRKVSSKEIIFQAFADGKNYNGYVCGMNNIAIWFYAGSYTHFEGKFEDRTFVANFNNFCDKAGITSPFKKTFDIKEA